MTLLQRDYKILLKQNKTECLKKTSSMLNNINRKSKHNIDSNAS